MQLNTFNVYTPWFKARVLHKVQECPVPQIIIPTPIPHYILTNPTHTVVHTHPRLLTPQPTLLEPNILHPCTPPTFLTLLRLPTPLTRPTLSPSLVFRTLSSILSIRVLQLVIQLKKKKKKRRRRRKKMICWMLLLNGRSTQFNLIYSTQSCPRQLRIDLKVIFNMELHLHFVKSE